MEKKFKVASDLQPYVENVLLRRNIKFDSTEGSITAAVSGNYFHKVIVRARCEKDDEMEQGLIVDVPRLHESERGDRLVLRELGQATCFKIVGPKRESKK